jgi:NADP-dependent 3-hydroxy acid dehydrogenase YdfG
MEPLQSEDVVNAIAYVVTQPERMSINEVLIRPTHQPN